MVGASPTELDSLNELIKSEHFYVKHAPSSAGESSSSSDCSSDEDETYPNEEVQESSPSAMPVKEEEEVLSLTDDCFSFEENMTLFEKLMKECLSNDEGTTSEELPDSVLMKNDKSHDMPAQEAKTSTLIPTNRKRTAENENAEIVNKLPKAGGITDSGSESGIHSDYSNPGSPYQEQLLLQFNDMNPVDDILFPELFPCLI